MAKFKVNPIIGVKVTAIENKGLLNRDYKPVDEGNITGCSAASFYHDQIIDIKILLNSYSQLISKDSRDISNYIEVVKTIDQIISFKYK